MTTIYGVSFKEVQDDNSSIEVEYGEIFDTLTEAKAFAKAGNIQNGEVKRLDDDGLQITQVVAIKNGRHYKTSTPRQSARKSSPRKARKQNG